ncbi:hypothetical protein SME53J_12080 [Serratia marcescens]|nr:hypothetical protein SME53J_12080 [Serratia marcescens]
MVYAHDSTVRDFRISSPRSRSMRSTSSMLSGEHPTRKNPPDSSIHPDGLTKKFVAARKASGLEFQESPPTFHELRSLSGRLYEKQNDKAFAQKAAGAYNGNDDAEISQNEGERVRDAVKDRISKFGHISDIFGQTKINPSKSKTQKKTEYDSYIRSREMALGREPCAKSWHLMQGLFSRAL